MKNTCIHQNKAASPVSVFMNRTFHFLYFFLLCFLLLRTFHHFNYKCFILSASMMLCLFLLYVTARSKAYIDACPSKCVHLSLFLSCIFVFAFSSVIGRLMLCTPFNDTGSVYYATAEALETGVISKEINDFTKCYWATGTSNHDYFLIYPHNIFLINYLLPYYRMITSIFSISMYTSVGVYASVLLNAASITCAVAFGFYAARKAKGNCTAYLYLLFSVTCIPYYIHAYKAYSDTLSLPYVAFSMFCLISAERSHSTPRRFWLILTGISLAVGYLIKGSLAVMLIAFCIYILLKFPSRILSALTLSAAFAICILGWHSVLNNSSYIDLTDAERFEVPKTHYLMMASIGDGGYRQDDLEYTMSFPTYEEKTTATLNKYLERVQSYGSADAYISFLIDKLSTGLSDAKFAQQTHLDVACANSKMKYFLLPGEDYHALFYCCTTIYLTVIYVFMLLSPLVNAFSHRIHISSVLNIAYFGSLLFFSFWEFKSRYLLNLLPLMLLLTAFSITDITCLLEVHFKKPHR